MAHKQEQTSWLTENAGVFVTSDRVVRIVGDDAQSWLNGQLTADVRTIAVGAAVYGLSTSIKGRVTTDAWAVHGAEGLALVLPATCAEAALTAYHKHIIMEDVELISDGTLRVVTVQGPKAQAVVAELDGALQRFPCGRLYPRPGFDVWVPAERLEQVVGELARAAQAVGGGLLDEAGWAYAHVALGVPRAGIDFGSETYPQEAGLKARAVSFSKGCYLGQEVVYMLENRGQLSRRLVQLTGLPPDATKGDQLFDTEGKRVGELTSVDRGDAGEQAPTLALGYVKRAQAEAGVQLRVRDADCCVCCVIGLTDGGCPVIAST